jgi:hypothetical protein
MVGAAPLAGCGADREEDEQQNLAILHELPTFPGARELEVGTAPYYGHEEGPFDGAEGHTTSITYRAPGGTTQRELIRFYTSRLEKGWGCKIERSGEIDITEASILAAEVCTYSSGVAATRPISVNPDSVTRRTSSFDVVADSRRLELDRHAGARLALLGRPARFALARSVTGETCAPLLWIGGRRGRRPRHARSGRSASAASGAARTIAIPHQRRREAAGGPDASSSSEAGARGAWAESSAITRREARSGSTRRSAAAVGCRGTLSTPAVTVTAARAGRRTAPSARLS